MEGSIGVLGASGGVGAAACRELVRAGRSVVLGGRARGRLEALSESLGGGEVRPVDVADRASVLRFCEGNAVVINASRFTDGLAEAVLEAGCHLVDATAFPLHLWRPRSAEVAARGATWVVHTGWLPGLPEVVGAYAEALAVARFGSAEVEVCAFDRNIYEGVGLDDMVRAFFWRPGVLDTLARLRGRPVPLPPGEAPLQPPMGATRLWSMPAPLGYRMATHLDMGGRHPLFVAFDPALMPALFTAMWYGRARSVAWVGERVVGPALRRWVERHGPAEVVRARAVGPQGQKLEVDFVETSRPGYWVSGVVPATVARLLAEGRAERGGIGTLTEAVRAEVVVEALAEAGLELVVRG